MQPLQIKVQAYLDDFVGMDFPGIKGTLEQRLEDMLHAQFSIAGVSSVNGVPTYRFANGRTNTRKIVLNRNGHTDIKLFDLPKAMNKFAAVKWLAATHNIEAVFPDYRKGE